MKAEISRSMKISNRFYFKSIFKIGLLTALFVFLFQMMSVVVLYNYIKLDYYLAFVGIFFLTIGLFIARKTNGGSKELTQLEQENGFGQLTSTELSIIRLISEGKTNKEIAANNFVELSTVKTHINNIYAKLNIRNRKEACTRYKHWQAIDNNL